MSDAGARLLRWVDNIIGFTELSKLEDHDDILDDADGAHAKVGKRGILKLHNIPLTYFGEVRPMFDSDEIELNGLTMDIFRDVRPSDLNGKWDISVISEPQHDSDSENRPNKPLYSLSRIRRVHQRDYPGHKVYSEYLAEYAGALIFNDGTYSSFRAYPQYLGKDSDGFGRWGISNWEGQVIALSQLDGPVHTGAWTIQENQEVTDKCNLALGMQFTKYYEWEVIISSNIGLPLCFATDPEGARQVFKRRDTESNNRRAALRNWVLNHWRAARPDKEVFVRDHLRGLDKFRWEGFDCQIRASEDAVAHELKAIQERKEMAREGKAVRVRQAGTGLAK